jgi:predicted HD phosphohydrolase
LLHDIGHLAHKDSAFAFQQGVDDSHELIGAKFLLRQFGVHVSEPVRLHVAAKRYLCFIDHFYWGNLSDQSKQTLELQGGPMDQSEAQNFSEHAHSKEAVQLRKWDDAAKQKNKETESLTHFLKIAEKYLQAQSISE